MRMRTAFFVMSSATALVAASFLATACSSDEAAPASTSGTDASRDSTSNSSSSGSIDGATDGGSDADTTSTCGAEGSACDYNGTKDGLCKGGICTGCVTTTDDNACKTAYGSKVDGGSLICENAECVPGDCHTHAQCTDGQICGLSVPNTCAKCASDAECKTAHGNDYVCNTSTGGCITNAVACTAVGQACLGSPNSVCCDTGGGVNTCATGECCGDGDCTADPAKNKCINRVCTGCAAVADGQYYVDPDVADDSAATGGPTCPFKTITKALAFIGNPATASTINVKANATIAAGETLPFIIPANITVKGDNAQPATINVAADKIGFILRGATAGLDHLVIDGQAKTATSGIVVQTGASSTTTLVQYVTVKDMKSDGIIVQNATNETTGGGVKLGPAVVSTGHGTAGTAPANGLVIKENGVAIVTGAVGAESHFDGNSDSGITVLDVGQLTLTGDVGATPPSTGTVTANANVVAGLWIAQTPGTVPVNAVTGLTAWQTSGPTSAGIRLLGGSSIKLRASSVLGNGNYGVHVTPFTSGLTVTNDVNNMDLGLNTTTEAGKNVLQAPTGASPNAAAGICLDVTAGVGAVLNAQGNIFTTLTKTETADCSGTSPPEIGKNYTCQNAQSIGVLGNAVNTNTVSTQGCAQKFSAQ